MTNQLSLETQEKLPYYINVANWGFVEVQKREGGGYTVKLKPSFEEWLAQKPLTREVAELLIKLQQAKAFSRAFVTAKLNDFETLAERLANIQLECFKRGAYIDAIQNGFVVVDEATDKVLAGVLPTLNEVENWLNGKE